MSSSFRPRIIPVLLLQEQELVKSVQFKQHRYIGDPVNAARLFNEFEADELILLDISARKANRHISPELVKEISNETQMPLAVGGGISDLSAIRTLIRAGAEKIILSSEAFANESFVAQACSTFGSSTISVCMDIGKQNFGKESVYTHNGTINTRLTPESAAAKLEALGVGEIILQSIPQDGKMNGYDNDLIRRVCAVVSIPIVALGGAQSMEGIRQTYRETAVSAFAAGSLFLYHGKNKGVLIHYPEKNERKKW